MSDHVVVVIQESIVALMEDLEAIEINFFLRQLVHFDLSSILNGLWKAVATHDHLVLHDA